MLVSPNDGESVHGLVALGVHESRWQAYPTLPVPHAQPFS